MLLESAEYLLVLVNIVEKDEVTSSKYKNIKKSGNKMVKILIRLKSLILFKFRSRNLFRFKKIQNTSAIRESHFLILNTKVVFTK